MKYIVKLEDDLWLAPWQGDPGRTILIENAKTYRTGLGAKIALGLARRCRPFPEAEVLTTHKERNK